MVSESARSIRRSFVASVLGSAVWLLSVVLLNDAVSHYDAALSLHAWLQLREWVDGRFGDEENLAPFEKGEEAELCIINVKTDEKSCDPVEVYLLWPENEKTELKLVVQRRFDLGKSSDGSAFTVFGIVSETQGPEGESFSFYRLVWRPVVGEDVHPGDCSPERGFYILPASQLNNLIRSVRWEIHSESPKILDNLDWRSVDTLICDGKTKPGALPKIERFLRRSGFLKEFDAIMSDDKAVAKMSDDKAVAKFFADARKQKGEASVKVMSLMGDLPAKYSLSGIGLFHLAIAFMLVGPLLSLQSASSGNIEIPFIFLMRRVESPFGSFVEVVVEVVLHLWVLLPILIIVVELQLNTYTITGVKPHLAVGSIGLVTAAVVYLFAVNQFRRWRNDVEDTDGSSEASTFDELRHEEGEPEHIV